ncbi:MAG: ribosome assembly cofactor RimP [Bacteroidales bacterium]|nr:ribosome assembly cofactor RimP [Bacteroidales bacterium]
MIDRQALADVVNAHLGDNLFLVDIEVSGDNRIVVEVDSREGSVKIDDCVAINRAVEASFDRDVEDYELEVGSAGLTSPFKVKAQYEKNLGNEVEVLTNDGRKLKGVLSAVDDDTFTIKVTKKVKPEGAKRPVMVEEDETINYNETKYTKYLIQFK